MQFIEKDIENRVSQENYALTRDMVRMNRIVDECIDKLLEQL